MCLPCEHLQGPPDVTHSLCGDRDTEMNEAEAMSLRSYQGNWEGCGESVLEEHGQSCGHGKKRRGAEGTQVSLWPNRLALQAGLLE